MRQKDIDRDTGRDIDRDTDNHNPALSREIPLATEATTQEGPLLLCATDWIVGCTRKRAHVGGWRRRRQRREQRKGAGRDK